MRRVLFILKSYFSHNRPNAMCVEAVSEELQKLGVSSDILSMETSSNVFSEDESNYVLIPNTDTLFSRADKLIHTPVGNSGLVKAVYSKLKKTLSNQRYDAVIAVVYPPESAQAAVEIKKDYPDIPLIIYEIDSCSNRYKSPKGALQRYITRRSYAWEHKIYSSADYIIHMGSHERHYSQAAFEPYSHKSAYCDIPNFCPLKIEQSNRKSDNVVKLLYAGAFYPEIREPDCALELLSKVNEKTKLLLSVYTGEKYSDWLNSKLSGFDFAKRCNEVSQQELLSLIAETDILVSVGNKNLDYLPSKTLLYMSTGKPVIHFYPDDEDVSLKYFRQYPNVYFVDERKPVTEQSVSDVNGFIKKDHAPVDFDILKKKLIKNTPEYTAGVIAGLLYENKNKS